MLKQFDNELVAAINKYGDNHIDIAIEGNTVYGFYHSKHDSFGVTEFYSLDELGGIEKLKEYENEFENLCVCKN